jgi:predicted Zn finger-like uncharacterized protein
MASPLPSAVVIACPRCGTRYQLAGEAIGPKGRKVSCANCGEIWQARAAPRPGPDDPDVLFDEAAERALDAGFAAEERAAAEPVPSDPTEEARLRTIAEIKAVIAPKPKIVDATPDAAGDKARQMAFDKRQAALSRQSPLARARRVLRLAGVSVLVVAIVGAVAFRTEIVRQFPDLAGAYEALGLGVNIVGLEFRDVTTLVTLRGGQNVMRVDGRIYSVAVRDVVVPPIVVTLLDDAGARLYEWSVLPQARDLEPGEVVDFSTQLTSPPQGAARVRLTFTDGRARSETPVAAAKTTEN